MRIIILVFGLVFAAVSGFCQESVMGNMPATPASAQADDTFWNTFFREQDDSDRIHYVRVFAEPVYRINGDNTASGAGGELGIMASHNKGDPTIGLSLGYYGFKDRYNSDYLYNILPVMLRAGCDFPLTDKGTEFSLWVGGGYSLNKYTSSAAGAQTAIDNSYILMAQTGLKSQVSKHIAISLAVGYQYLRPWTRTITASQTTSSYVDLSAPFIKLYLEF